MTNEHADFPDLSYSPGTRVDTDFLPVPEECKRILRLLVARTPGSTQDEEQLNGVEFQGDDLLCISGPMKSQTFTVVLYAMLGIIGLETLRLRGHSESTTNRINTNHAGLYPATPGLATIDNVTDSDLIKLATLSQWNPDRAPGYPLVHLATAIYETPDKGIWFQLHGSLEPWVMPNSISISKDVSMASVKTHDEA